MTEQAVPPASTEDESAGGGPTAARTGVTPVDVVPTDGADRADTEPDPADAEPDPADAEAESADDEAEPADDEPARGGWHPLLRVLVTLGAVAVLVGALVTVGLRYDVADRLLTPDRTADARVGDCLAPLPDVAEGGQRRAAEARVVACASPDAAYDVVGRLDGQTEEQVRDGRQCEPFVAEGGTYYTYSSIPPGGTGYLLCLVPHR
ncbi:LppU/SCO3897 family protein [Micromonospora sagamiensis]|uniref:Uncharacterized protein n=1 Tax=Micromonospora sagamiensis TaxID=47875 RepID=A0A562WM22_9ACTN|nr:hypothetical protein [Micromonospora sagamiensis]TWJ31238.1 hypothetical protein JD81_04793 [Micromonospora sagamiensis]